MTPHTGVQTFAWGKGLALEKVCQACGVLWAGSASPSLLLQDVGSRGSQRPNECALAGVMNA